MQSDYQKLDAVHNTSRYFVEYRQVAWAALFGVLVWGIFGYLNMPQRKDPEIPVRETLVIARWPGQPADRIEELLTRKVEERIAQNSKVTELRSVTKEGAAFVYAKLDEKVDNTASELDDIRLKLDAMQLPDGAAPLELVKDFGDTATLMLTVASPTLDARDRAIRVKELEDAMRDGRVAIVWPHARTLEPAVLRELVDRVGRWLAEEGYVRDVQPRDGSGFTAVDAIALKSRAEIVARLEAIERERLHVAELHPDIWSPLVMEKKQDVAGAIAQIEGAKYTYRELDRYTEQIEKALKALEPVARVSRSGALGEQVQLVYSQERWGAYHLPLDQLRQALSARSGATMGTAVETEGRKVAVVPQADFTNEQQLRDVLVPVSGGQSLYLRDLAKVERGYETPAQFLNFYQYRDEAGEWRRARAITLDVQMRSGKQIQQFEEVVNAELDRIAAQLPADLVLARTSDQPLQVKESMDLFMGSLWEAIALVVLVSWIGFWEWRSALVMAIAIPITLAMTFGMMYLLGVDLQQVSIASLIIALGLLVDDPVVAGDAIKRELGAGRSPLRAAWQGPTKLARAILFATITNIVAYLPFLLLSGDTRRFLFTLPVVMACSLIASRIVSMTFIPLLGYYLLKSVSEPEMAERRKRGFGALYYRIGGWAIDHRWQVFAAAAVLLIAGFAGAGQLKEQFFPFERQYLSYVDVWLPQTAPVSATNATARKVERILLDVADNYAKQAGRTEPVLRSLTSWVGGGGPRYWLSSTPEAQQANYAHVLIEVYRKGDNQPLIPLWQRALDEQIPGATLDVRRLETSAPVGIPVQIRISGNDTAELKRQSEKMKAIFREVPIASRLRDDWGEDALTVDLKIDHERATMAGVSEADIVRAAAGGVDGMRVATIRDGDKLIPVVTRLRMDERAQASDFTNLYIYGSQGNTRVLLSQVARPEMSLRPAKIGRYQQYRTITVCAFPKDGYLPSEVLNAAMPRIEQFRADLPPGMRMEIAGEYKEQIKGFKELTVVMIVSILSIYFALLVQFRNAVKPLIVFAAIPFGMVGAFTGLLLMDAPFGFMAFLGVASLVGVIVSHIIVLFDFIEEGHEAGMNFREALLDAGILRLRPVLITVAATVIALVPLARNGGPLWEPLCYVQIGGLTLSTVVTLLIVPVVYAIFVLDLKWVRWDHRPQKKIGMTVAPPAALEAAS